MNHLKIAKGQSGEISPNLVILPKSTRYLELTWVGKVHSRTPEIQKIAFIVQWKMNIILSI